MTSSKSTEQFKSNTALVTGANSGLGFEASGQLAEAGYGRVILACRTLAKAEAAKQALTERVGSNPFETLEVDVSSVASAQAASDELVRRGHPIDVLLLNAGMVSGEAMNKSVDGFEVSFASSIIGHHVMTIRLLDAGMLPEGARVVIAGSEAARNDLPSMMGMQLYDFATDEPEEFGDNLHDAMVSFARGCRDRSCSSGTRYYATTKLFTSWWSRGHGSQTWRAPFDLSQSLQDPTWPRTRPAIRPDSRTFYTPRSYPLSAQPSVWTSLSRLAPNATSTS